MIGKPTERMADAIRRIVGAEYSSRPLTLALHDHNKTCSKSTNSEGPVPTGLEGTTPRDGMKLPGGQPLTIECKGSGRSGYNLRQAQSSRTPSAACPLTYLSILDYVPIVSNRIAIGLPLMKSVLVLSPNSFFFILLVFFAPFGVVLLIKYRSCA